MHSCDAAQTARKNCSHADGGAVAHGRVLASPIASLTWGFIAQNRRRIKVLRFPLLRRLPSSAVLSMRRTGPRLYRTATPRMRCHIACELLAAEPLWVAEHRPPRFRLSW